MTSVSWQGCQHNKRARRLSLAHLRRIAEEPDTCVASGSLLELCSCQVPGKTWQQQSRSAGKRRLTNNASKLASPESWCMPWRRRLCRRRCTDTGVQFSARMGRWCSIACRCLMLRSALIPSLCRRQMAAVRRTSNGLSTADVQHRVNESPFSAAIMSS